MGIFLMTTGLGSFIGSALIQIVNAISSKTSNSHWYDGKDINQGRLDYFFYILAALLGVNFLVFCAISSRYTYVSDAVLRKDEDDWSKRGKDGKTSSIDDDMTSTSYDGRG